MAQPAFTTDYAAGLYPKREVRAVWLTTIGGLDWPRTYAHTAYRAERQKQELCDMLDSLQRCGINTILLQTRIRATVIYPSALEPWDGCVAGGVGRAPAAGYDPLAFATAEAHQRGMQLHAWVVCIPCGHWEAEPARRLRQRGLPLRHIGADAYLNPESPATGDYLAKLCAEIAGRYDIDGIHLDYIRYPEAWPEARINKEAGRQHITRIVEQIARRVRGIKPWLWVSCATIGKNRDLARHSSRGWNAYSRVCQDADRWLAEGIVDAVYPMMYYRREQFTPFAIDWAEHAGRGYAVGGLGWYQLSPKEANWDGEVVRQQLRHLRACGLGNAGFRARFLLDDTKGLARFLSRDFHAQLALPPVLPAARGANAAAVCGGAPAAPKGVRVDVAAQCLRWTAEPGVSHNVYAAEGAVNTADARALVAVCVPGDSLRVPLRTGRRYAVAAIDRYGRESAAVEVDGSRTGSAYANGGRDGSLWADGGRGDGVAADSGYMSGVSVGEPGATAPAAPVICRDGRLPLPPAALAADLRLYEVRTLQGVALAAMLPRGDTLNVRALPDGSYALWGYDRKGTAHRLGSFALKTRNL